MQKHKKLAIQRDGLKSWQHGTYKSKNAARLVLGELEQKRCEFASLLDRIRDVDAAEIEQPECIRIEIETGIVEVRIWLCRLELISW